MWWSSRIQDGTEIEKNTGGPPVYAIQRCAMDEFSLEVRFDGQDVQGPNAWMCSCYDVWKMGRNKEAGEEQSEKRENRGRLTYS